MSSRLPAPLATPAPPPRRAPAERAAPHEVLAPPVPAPTAGTERPGHGRRSVLTTLGAVPLAGALTACGGGGGSSRRSGGVTRITFWSALRGSQQVVDEFNRTHDSVKVDFEQIPSGPAGGYLKLSNAARAGNSPDVATIEYPEVPEFAIDGVARDITGLVDDRLRARLLPQALGLTTFEKRIYTVPVDVEPMVMHYRRDLFERFGIRVPRTWDEFEQAARTVRRNAPDQRLAIFQTDGGETFAAHAWQAGAQWYDLRDGAWNISLADEPTRRVAAFWQRLIDEDLVFTNPGTGRQYDAQVAKGRILVRFSGAWEAGAQMAARPAQNGQWRVAPLPQWDPDRPVVGTQGGSTFSVTKDCRHPEAAMEFIAWQVSDPAALRARLSSGASSQYPAVPGLLGVDRKAFDRSYYGGQDIYRLFDGEAHKIRDSWRWGPRMRPTITVMQDGFARMTGGQGSVIDAVRQAQRGTMPDLRSLGLATTEHST